MYNMKGSAIYRILGFLFQSLVTTITKWYVAVATNIAETLWTINVQEQSLY